jgi:hypothetical protein
VHSLRNYGGEEEAVYDGNAYTYSSTYLDGQLKLYAQHVTTPTMSRKRPSYHMIQLDTYALTGSRKGFVEGATAFRNARDMAQRHCDEIVRETNARARQSNFTQSHELELPEPEQHGYSGSDALVDHEKSAASRVTATGKDAVFHNSDAGSTAPQPIYAEDGEHSHEQQVTILDVVELTPTSVTGLLPSNPNTQTAGSKRNKESQSPPSNSQRNRVRSDIRPTHPASSALTCRLSRLLDI